MTRLTLEWHLRGIIEGTVEAECVRHDIEPGVGDRHWPTTQYYADPTVEGNREQVPSQAEAGSYTTGFTQESGDFCDTFDVPAHKALNSDDPVKFLDAVAHDPVRPPQQRFDAAALLNEHIWPDAPRNSHSNSFALIERDDIDYEAWIESGMTRRTDPPMYFAMECVNSTCKEGECLADPDTLRDEGIAVCMICGTEQPEPEYP